MRGEGDGFRDPARQQARDKRRDADNRRAFERRPHHKFQAVARIKQREEAQHNKVRACQPVPDQREGANKQAEEGEGAVGQMQQTLGNGFLL